MLTIKDLPNGWQKDAVLTSPNEDIPDMKDGDVFIEDDHHPANILVCCNNQTLRLVGEKYQDLALA